MCFFFSSRRRHTRWTGDWSSDVCSSDLLRHGVGVARLRRKAAPARRGRWAGADAVDANSWAVIKRDLSRQVDDRCLGRAVAWVLRRGLDAEAGGGADDVAASTPEEMGQRRADAVEHAPQIDGV